MIPVAKEWNPKQKALKSFLSSNDEKKAVALCLQMHSKLHDSQLTLIADEPQIFSKTLKKRVAASIVDTGNAMDLKEAVAFSKTIKMNELLSYRFKVGEKSQLIIKGLSRLNVKKTPSNKQLDRLLKEHVIINHNESIWLLDFWSKKTIAGLLLMPITRHQIVHLNNCLKLKAKFMKYYRTTV